MKARGDDEYNKTQDHKTTKRLNARGSCEKSQNIYKTLSRLRKWQERTKSHYRKADSKSIKQHGRRAVLTRIPQIALKRKEIMKSYKPIFRKKKAEITTQEAAIICTCIAAAVVLIIARAFV